MTALKDIVRRAFLGITTEGKDLTQKSARGGLWVFLGAHFEYILSMVQTLILVRILSTLDFGIFRVAVTAVWYSRMLTEAGINQALVQRKTMDRDVIDTAWVIQIARNLLQFGALFLLAGPAAAFFKTPAIEAVLQVMAFKFVFLAFQSPGVPLLLRDMKFKRREIFERSYNIIAFGATVTAAVILKSYWAFVIGDVLREFINTVGSYVMAPYRPRLRFRMTYARELIRFGKHVYFSGILAGLSKTLDDILVGRFLGLEALGVYGVMKGLVTKPAVFLSRPLVAVAFPAFSKIQSDGARVERAYSRILRLVALVALPVYAGMTLVASSAVIVLLTKKYHGGIGVFQIFCAAGCIEVFNRTAGPLFGGTGKPYLTWIRMLSALLIFAPLLFFLSIKYDANGAAMAQVCRQGIVFTLGIVMLWRCVGISLREMLKAVIRPVLVTLVMAAVLLPVVLWVSQDNVLWLIALSLSGALIYIVVSFAINKPGVDEVRNTVRSLLADSTPRAESEG